MKSPPEFDDAYVGLFATAERIARCILGDGARAERIAAETLARGLVSWRRVRHRPEAWVIRMAADLALDSVRRSRPVEPPKEQDGADAAGPARAEVLAGLHRLARRHARVVALHYLVGFEDAHIADVLGVSEDTVKIQLGEGLEALRTRLPVESEEVDLDTTESA